MPRLARVVVPNIPHHIIQRGNRRMRTFFCDDDYREYLFLMAEWCKRCSVSIWSYCLMPNHVHLIAVPEAEDGLRRAIGHREGAPPHLQGNSKTVSLNPEYRLISSQSFRLVEELAGSMEELI